MMAKRLGYHVLAVAVLAVAAGCGGGKSDEITVTIKRTGSGGAAGANAGGTAAPSDSAGDSVAPTGEPGNLVGVVRFDGAPPDLAPLVAQDDPKVDEKDRAICASHPIPNQSLIVGPGGGIKNVFVYLKEAPKGAVVPPVPEGPVIFDQKGCTFFPHALLVRTNRTVDVINSDPIAHNTHTFPQRNNGFNSLIGGEDKTGKPIVYTSRENLPLQVKCDIHAWMSAYQLPLDHDFAAITDDEGKFEIRNLPPGKHEFIVWQEKKGYLDRKYVVDIKPGETTEVTLSYGADDFAAFNGPHPKEVRLASQP